MSIRIDEIESEGRGSGAWRIPPRRAFAKSDVYHFLNRALTRYTQGQTTGRSFLLAGHRGAGKTALVEQVILDLKWDSIERTGAGVQGSSAPARPFLVKLHGPSLIGPTLAVAAGGAPTDGGDSSTADYPVRGSHQDEGRAQQALVQITLALYRALAEEAAWGFALHARAEATRTGSDQIELAGQLNLDLDLAPEPGVLRQYWKRLGRLGVGVAWPNPPVKAKLPPDQGIREIVALATAGQAFRVCAGKSNVKEENTDLGELTQIFASKRSADFKDILNKLSGLIAGVGVGALLRHSPSMAIPAAIGAGLLTNLSFSWSDTRTRSKKRSSTYTFIRDTSTPTLDRELPLAINRIKAAGLTPVFVVDELDKINNSVAHIQSLLHRLKHIVTDFGFFCFLTDRDCYDLMKIAVDGSAYPVEHTYFSERLFLSYAPLDLLTHLLSIMRATDAESNPAERTAVVVLALETLLHARPHFIDVTRRLTRACDNSGVVRASVDDLGSPRYLLAATFQLAIQVAFLDPEIPQRVEEDASFLQLLVDTLYWPVAVWEREQATFELSTVALRQHLISRASVSASGVNAARDAALAKALDDADLDYLQRRLVALLALLSDFDKLKDELARLGDRLPMGLAAAMPDFTRSFFDPSVAADRKDGSSFAFRYNVRGRLIRPEAEAEGAEKIQRVDEALQFIASLRALGAKLYLPLDILTELDLLPLRVTARGLGKIRVQLLEVKRARIVGNDIEDRLTQVDDIRGQLLRLGDRLGRFLLIAAHANAAAGRSPKRLREALRSVVRLHGLDLPHSALIPSPVGRAPPPSLAGDAEILDAWRDYLLAATRLWPKRPAFTASELSRSWEGWRRRLVSDASGEEGALSSDDVLQAVAGLAPGRLFRANLQLLTLGDWSAMVLHFAESSQDDWPAWVLVAALRRLGASIELQTQMLHEYGPSASLSGVSQTLVLKQAEEMIGGSNEGSGTLLITDDDSPALSWPLESGNFILALRSSDYVRYGAFIDKLAGFNAFHTVAREDNG